VAIIGDQEIWKLPDILRALLVTPQIRKDKELHIECLPPDGIDDDTADDDALNDDLADDDAGNDDNADNDTGTDDDDSHLPALDDDPTDETNDASSDDDAGGGCAA